MKAGHADRRVSVEDEALGRDPELVEIINRLIDVYRPHAIYLFGSKARGDDSADSDYDLLVVVSDSAPPRLKRSGRAYEALRETGVPVDVLVCARSYFDARRHLKASLPGTVLREGRLLYAP